MLTEIAKEEQFLKTEEVRLVDRPERLEKLRRAHEEWIVWRVRKELEKIRAYREHERVWSDAEAARDRAERERLETLERLRAAERDRENRERQLREERERVAREGQGPYAWQQYTRPSFTRSDPPRPAADPPPQPQPPPQPPRSQASEWDREARVAREGWTAYQERWNGLQATASTSKRPLRFGDIPWPIFSTGPFNPADITTNRVRQFLLSRFHSTDKTTKERLRNALIVWHPDKFQTRWLKLVDEKERTLVTEGVNAVARAIYDLLANAR